MVKMASFRRPQSLYEAAIALGLFLLVPWECMQFMSVAFPGHTFFFYIDLHIVKTKKSSCLKPPGLDPDTWYVASAGRKHLNMFLL